MENNSIRTAILFVAAAGTSLTGWAADENIKDSPTAVTAISSEELANLPKRPVDELITTARRAEENVLTVPLSISTFSQDQIQDAQITNLSDVAALTPSFSYQNYFGQDLSVPTIRGVSQIDIFGDPNAPVYIDGIYVSSSTGINFSFLDVERIEVLRGPQPAYFGYNAFSGAVNFVSAKPTDELMMNGELTVGSDGKRRVAGTVSGPLAGTWLSGRLSALWDDFDGTYDNASTDLFAQNQDIGGAEYETVFGSLYLTPNEQFSARLNLYISDATIDPPAQNSVTANCEEQLETGGDPDPNGTPNPDRLLNYCGELPSVDDGSLATIPGETGQTRDVFRTTLIMDWNPGYGTWSSLTGYSETKSENWASADRGAAGTTMAYLSTTPGFIPGSFDINTFQAPYLQVSAGEAELTDLSQEFRFTSNQDQRTRFMAGVYYRYTEDEAPIPIEDLWAPTSSLPSDMSFYNAPFPPFDAYPNFCPCFSFGPPGFPGGSAEFGGYIFGPWFADTVPGFDYNQTTKKTLLAGFGSIAFDFTDQWTGYAEGRYTDYDEKFYTENTAIPAVDRRSQYDDNFFNWRTSLEFHPNELTTYYGSIATGVKQGGLDNYTPETVLPDPNCPGPDCVDEQTVSTEYGQEDNVTYELGYKAALLDGNVIIDTAIFYIDWNDIVLPQIITEVNGTPIVPTSVSANLGDASIAGIEFGLISSITETLDGGFNISYNDGQFDDGNVATFATFPSFAPNGDMSGQDLPRTPEWQSNINLTYHNNLNAYWDWYTRGDFNYQSSWWVGLPNQAKVPGRFRANLRIGVESDNYTIELWANNVFDNDSVDAAFRDVYLANATAEGTNNFSTLFPYRMSQSNPQLRTYGLTLRGRF